MKDHFPSAWDNALHGKITASLWKRLEGGIGSEYKKSTVFPRREDLFRAFSLCLPSEVKVVILGQDPYHGEGEAHGLSFSVPDGVKCPPSLRNIMKELGDDVGHKDQPMTDLSHWARQGVLLLNTVLSVRKDEPFSHRNLGWEEFTGIVFEYLVSLDRPMVFMVWGKPAEAYAQKITSPKHLVLTAPHPSPLSAYRGFFGSRHFSKANVWLREHEVKTIMW